jgi:hypothetical protein
MELVGNDGVWYDGLVGGGCGQKGFRVQGSGFRGQGLRSTF